MNEPNVPRTPSQSAFQKRCATPFKMAGMALLIVLMGCAKLPERLQADSRDHLLGWFKLPGRGENNQVVSGEDALIPVFKRDKSYYSVCRGGEVPFKECPEGLEWALTPSSMVGTKIGFNETSKVYYIVIADAQLANNWQFYVSGEKQPMTRAEQPSGLLDPKARRPRSHGDFIGWYQPLWFPVVRIQIRRDGDRYISQEQEFGGPEPGSWKTRAKPLELTTLPDQLGFTGFERDNNIRLVYNDTFKRFEIVQAGKETNLLVVRMPLARVPAPASPEGGRAPSPMARIGIPAWH